MKISYNHAHRELGYHHLNYLNMYSCNHQSNHPNMNHRHPMSNDHITCIDTTCALTFTSEKIYLFTKSSRIPKVPTSSYRSRGSKPSSAFLRHRSASSPYRTR